MSLKIFLFLNYNKGSAYFKDLQSYLNRSKSQISVALKKLENNKLIVRNNKRPQKIFITMKGNKVKNNTLREILKYKKQEVIIIPDKKSSVIHNKKLEPLISTNIKQKSIPENKSDVFENYISEVEKIISKELKEDFGNHLPKEIIRDITRHLKNNMHDKLYEFF